MIQDLTDTVSFFTQFAQGYRNPDFTDAYNTYTNYAFGYTIIPNPDLKAEYSSGFELGLRGTKDDVRWSLVFHRNSYDDLNRFIKAIDVEIFKYSMCKSR